MITIHTDQSTVDQLPDQVRKDLLHAARATACNLADRVDIIMTTAAWENLLTQYPQDLAWPDQDQGATWIQRYVEESE